MATLSWQNNSKQLVKWLVIINGQLQGSGIDPGQSFQMDSAGVTWAGWALSGFNGFTFTQIPTPSGVASMFVATEYFSEGEDFSSLLKETPDSSGD
jgi:hypothetical protein